MTIETKHDTDVLYGFGASAPEARLAMRSRQAQVLSLFAIALTTAVVTLIVLLLPVGSASASPMITNAAQAPNTFGYAAVAAFGLATIVCATILLAPGFMSRRKTRRHF